MKTNFKKEFRDLEMRVLNSLRDLVNESEIQSQHIDNKAIKVNVFDYTELVIIHGVLTFIDNKGLQYSVFADADLEDLIDILNQTPLT